MIRARALSQSKLKSLSCLSIFFAQPLASITAPLSSNSYTFLPVKPQIPSKNPQFLFLTSPFSTQSAAAKPPSKQKQNPEKKPSQLSSKALPLTRDGNYNEETPRNTVCSGCGIHMQESNPKHPGFFVTPNSKSKEPILKRGGGYSVPEFTDSLKKGLILKQEGKSSSLEKETLDRDKSEKPVVCVRCHSLRHYGKVKDPTVENLLPEFDFDHTVGKRLASTSGARSVVLLVVDASDFDGSFPRKVAKLVSDVADDYRAAWKKGESGNVPRIVLVVTKLDLLPSSISPTGFQHWVRQRAREGGASRISKLHIVSPVKDWGVKSLVEDIVEMAGPRGTVWAVGAQNAGKSTLINAIAKTVGGKVGYLTEAPVPGTTLGIVRVEGVLPGKAKLFDTPGLLHPHQITTRLTREEQKLVHLNKELKPRTYRLKVGHSVHIARLMRLDIEKLSVESMYATVWASPHLPLHMGKTQTADRRMLDDHFGRQLQPPIGHKRVKELGEWVRKEFQVSGGSWDSSSVDVAAAGLGWFALGLNGEAELSVWTYQGVDVVLRSNPLIPSRAQVFEETGFTVSKIVSQADQALNKSQRQSEKKRKQNELNPNCCS